jgi:hypothetical protein
MFAVEKGLGWSPWTLLVVFGVPALVVVGYFFARIEPETLRWVFPQETGLATGQRVVIAVLTGLVLFGFYGAAGWWDGGAVAHRMSVWSVCLVAPLVAVGSGVWMGRRKLVTDSVA